MFKRVRYYIFLKDVLLLALSAFGGPQAHIALMFDLMVKKRRYLSEEDLIELNALCQILPGPTSTQTITAIGFRIGGPNLAYLTLLVWMIPAVTIMTIAGIIISHLQARSISIEFTKFIQPMAVGFVSYAALRISQKVIKTKTAAVILVLAAIGSFVFKSPFVFPLLILAGGAFTAFKYKAQPIEEKDRIKIQWANFILWAGFFVFIAALGGVTRSLPVRLLENFYRSGSLIFGGGQVLIPLLYTEFVEFKRYLTSEEFLTGYAMVQTVPGPVFSFCAYIGTLAMRNFGIGGQIVGALVASIGIFLPGTFLIFFVIRFWEGLKKYRIIKASLEGINAASSGMVVAAAVLMFLPLESNVQNIAVIAGTFVVLVFTKIPAPVIILLGLGAGFLF
ncbi:Chromate transport protein ChrA [Fulvivirga imtechensis AK7]|uniref:Chromate transport protein ChrA n=1 Tax=Fulvivirga imtechensis AK7 TaxID=1237149 RepID=L8JQG9_9BACT|nr:chromate efflux transporter [Fulvivirga imtechensis]ELR69714.1 Chromate transport protein ChrA [Fulvivirga imtechensis AK7]